MRRRPSRPEEALRPCTVGDCATAGKKERKIKNNLLEIKESEFRCLCRCKGTKDLQKEVGLEEELKRKTERKGIKIGRSVYISENVTERGK